METSSATILVNRTGTLGTKLAAFLLRRASFRFTKEMVDDLAGRTAASAVNLLFNNPAPDPYLERPLHHDDPDDTDWIPNDSNRLETLRRQYVAAWWFQNALLDHTAHHKSAFFLHTTFTVGYSGVAAGAENRHVSRYFYDHLRLLNWTTQVGMSLKTVAKKITLDNMMLVYLDNRANFKEPDLNENYGREFLELFTIGAGDTTPNYTEADITEASKVFTGFTNFASRNTVDPENEDPDTLFPRGKIDPTKHEPGNKTFSNLFNNAVITGEAVPTQAGMLDEMDQLVEMVFDRYETAQNYARKIFRFYVSTELDEAAVTDIADDLVRNNFRFINTIKRLLKSDYFYSRCSTDHGGGDIIKNPFELLSESMSFFGTNLPEITDTNDRTQLEAHFRTFGSLFMHNQLGLNSGMVFLSPINVAGYPAYYQAPLFDKSWYSAGTNPTRFGIPHELINNNFRRGTEIDTLAYIIYLHEEKGIDVSIADNLMNEMVDYFFPQDITPERYDLLKGIFLMDLSELNWFFEWFLYYGGGPENFPGDGDENRVRPHTDALVTAILSSHEFQLK